ncbi:hypothetical protein HWV62_39930 [Athelia sp. TMB]|nr:hypothetical protein HWV62_39930 [Athelia sp. TMB]
MPDYPQEHIATIADTAPVTEAGAPFNHAGADVILRSSDSVDFRVFKIFLSFGSPFFEDMFSLPQSAGDSSETRDGLPVALMPETAKILRMLLAMCYPMGATDQPALDKLEEVDMLLNAAIKYGLEGVEKRAREALVAPPCLRGNEIRVFAIACRHKMDAEARSAARATLERPILEMDSGPELEQLSGAKVFALLKYHKACIKAARRAVEDERGTNVAPPCPSIGLHCDYCGKLRPFVPVDGKVSVTLDILENIPGREEIEKASARTISLWMCNPCGWQTTASVGAFPSSIPELSTSYRKKLEDAISAFFAQTSSPDDLVRIPQVPLDLQL